MFHLLQIGHPMFEYESMKKRSQALRMPHQTLVRHQWLDDCGLLACASDETSKGWLGYALYIVVTCDKVTIVDNQLRISIHAYYVQDFYMQPLLVSLERLIEGASASCLVVPIVDALAIHNNLDKDGCCKKLTLFGWMGLRCLRWKASTCFL